MNYASEGKDRIGLSRLKGTQSQIVQEKGRTYGNPKPASESVFTFISRKN